MLDALFRTLARSADPVSRLARKAARRIVHEEDGLANDPERNGEYWLLDRLAELAPPSVVFDVGANRGEWSRAVLKRMPDAQIHAFEIVPDTHAKLSQALNGSAVANCFGLGAQEGTVPVYVTAGNDLVASTLNLSLRQGEPTACPIRRGDAYCLQQGIDRIDLLKIDVEGAEHLVMDGFGDMLPRIGVIQWEMGMANADSRVLLKDYYERLKPAGFAIGRLTRDRVAFKGNYDPRDEGFALSNWVAVNRKHWFMLKALS